MIAAAIFARYAKTDFAAGYYETSTPVAHAFTSTSATAAVPYTYTQVMTYKSAQCKATVAGLDQAAFEQALAEFLEQSRQKLFEVLADEN